MGIEPTQSAWKAEVLPLNYTRATTKNRVFRGAVPAANCSTGSLHRLLPSFRMVEGVGFEPTKAEPSDLQSDPVGRLGTPPAQRKAGILPQMSVSSQPKRTGSERWGAAHSKLKPK
jgi:hypothetical protein